MNASNFFNRPFRLLPIFFWVILTTGLASTNGQDVPMIEDVPMQPFKAQIKRVVEALNFLGEPLSQADLAALNKAMDSDDQKSVIAIQKIMDRRVIASVNINPESRVKSWTGPSRQTTGSKWLVGIPGQGS